MKRFATLLALLGLLVLSAGAFAQAIGVDYGSGNNGTLLGPEDVIYYDTGVIPPGYNYLSWEVHMEVRYSDGQNILGQCELQDIIDSGVGGPHTEYVSFTGQWLMLHNNYVNENWAPCAGSRRYVLRVKRCVYFGPPYEVVVYSNWSPWYPIE